MYFHAERGLTVMWQNIIKFPSLLASLSHKACAMWQWKQTCLGTRVQVGYWLYKMCSQSCWHSAQSMCAQGHCHKTVPSIHKWVQPTHPRSTLMMWLGRHCCRAGNSQIHSVPPWHAQWQDTCLVVTVYNFFSRLFGTQQWIKTRKLWCNDNAKKCNASIHTYGAVLSSLHLHWESKWYVYDGRKEKKMLVCK